VRDGFGRVVYSHKTHEKARELASASADRGKWINTVLTTVTSGTIISALITDERALLIVSSGLSALALAYVIYQLSFNPEQEAERHRAAAKELWLIRERYLALLTDFAELADEAIRRRRDELTADLKLVYQFAPDTTSKAYKSAQAALKLNEEMTFTADEIDTFLPPALRVGRTTDQHARRARQR
jgi:hypothetical protein